MNKNQILRGVCSDYTFEGLGVVKVEGIPFFIRQILIGEEIEFIATKLKKTYGYGKVLQIINKAKNRQEPACPHYGKCGGCQLQHMNMEEQLLFKQNLVKNNMQRIAKLDVEVKPTLGCSEVFHYRNKAQIPMQIRQQVKMGFYRFYSNDIIDMNTCMIQSDMINQIMLYVKQLMSTYDFADVFKHLLIKHAFATDEVMVVFVAKKEKIQYLDEVVKSVVDQFENIKSVILNINNREDNVILGEKEIILFGKEKITDKLGDLQFDISSKSFYQVNPSQTLHLYRSALEQAQINKEDTVIDLYCGVGTISLFLAKQAKKVIGIEIVEEAIEDAKRNAVNNKIDNVEFVCSDAAAYAKKLATENKNVDVIVVDPPRKGCDAQTLKSIVTMQPQSIVYISCNPSTLARDMQILAQDGYIAKSVQPVDMFPNTHHVECVCVLNRR